MLVGSKVRHLSKFEMTPRVGERPESAHCRLRPAATFDRIAAKSLSNRGEAASTAWVLGQIDEALPLAERALADAESAAHPPTMGVVLAIAALLGLVRCNPEAVATYGHAESHRRLDAVLLYIEARARKFAVVMLRSNHERRRRSVQDYNDRFDGSLRSCRPAPGLATVLVVAERGADRLVRSLSLVLSVAARSQ